MRSPILSSSQEKAMSLAWLVACLWGLAPGPGVLGAGESSPAMASLDPSTMS